MSPEKRANPSYPTEYAAYQRGFKDGAKAAKKEAYRQLMDVLNMRTVTLGPIGNKPGRPPKEVRRAVR